MTDACWTVEALRDHMDQLVSRVERDIARAEAKAEKASDKAESLATQRAALQNEWRATVNDVMATMVPRSEYAIAHQSVIDRLDMVSRRVDQQLGRGMGQTQLIMWIFLTIAGLISVAGIIINLLLR